MVLMVQPLLKAFLTESDRDILLHLMEDMGSLMVDTISPTAKVHTKSLMVDILLKNPMAKVHTKSLMAVNTLLRNPMAKVHTKSHTAVDTLLRNPMAKAHTKSLTAV